MNRVSHFLLTRNYPRTGQREKCKTLRTIGRPLCYSIFSFINGACSPSAGQRRNCQHDWQLAFSIYSARSGWVIGTLENRMAGPFKSAAPSFMRPHLNSKKFTKVCLPLRIRTSFIYLRCTCWFIPAKMHAERPSSYLLFMSELVYEISDFSMTLSNDFGKTRWWFNICLLLVFWTFSYKKRKSRRKMKLLLLVENKISHFCLIKNFWDLMHHLARSSRKRLNGPKTRFCGNCMQPIVKQNFQRSTCWE